MKNANNTDSLLSLAADYYYFKEGSTEKQIAQILLKNICKIPSWTIEQMAANCNISISTCRRFIKEIGYDSYIEFKMKISDLIKNYDFNTPTLLNPSAPDIHQYIEQTTKDIRRDVENLEKTLDPDKIMETVLALHEYEHIIIHDLFKSTMHLAFLSHLALTGKTVTLSADTVTQQNNARNADASQLFLLVYDGLQHSKETLNTLPTVHTHGAEIILISSIFPCPYSELCRTVLYIGQGSSPLSSMLLLDLTYSYIGELYKSMYISGKKLI
ncbi:DNA-binding MurR/RpiR family transcriptional regulator [Catenibacillus scindens]|uniref:DNA-binding MurR/RpiR family transcriptional regulator n=1 Tax=Catenibacillus scindens TaxID=673271 RepID=A0A7W8HDF3_9FIRM|nr:MurR/RpiR family transcriptional regulator [Catenibacillus scindens]MBB5266357.1 DNA-binding MurR/RpiR family transcriptional regulator [Catenibacillus scindens]